MVFKSLKISSGGGEYSFFTDDGERYTISAADAKRLGLSELCVEDMPFVFDDDELMVFLAQKLSAVKYCSYLISFSAKSEGALKKRLREKEYSDEAIEAALDVLRSSGVTDDERLCAEKYAYLAQSKLYGPYRLRAEMMSKGFNREAINEAERTNEIDFDALLSRLIKKLLNSSRPSFSDRKEREKFKAKLSRYGYGIEEINRVLSILSELDE